MKKLLLSIAICLLLIPTYRSVRAQENTDIVSVARAAGYEVLDIHKPKASIVIDGKTGDVVWADNIDLQRNPASITKIMTLYLVFDAIQAGRLSEETLITATDTDEAISKIYAISNNHIYSGVAYSVKDLIAQVLVPSSNVSTLMLANYLSNNDADVFLDQMNQKATELGMQQTKFYNATGAEAVSFEGYYTPKKYDNQAGNITTARDLALLTYHFVNKYPSILTYTNQVSVTTMAGTPYEETFQSYNHSLPGAQYGIEGVDGLKTGSSPTAGFNLIATAKRGDTRLISVVLGTGDWSDQAGEYYRHPFANAILEKSFSEYAYQKVLSAGTHEIDNKQIILDEDVYATVKKNQQVTMSVDNNELRIFNGLDSVSDKVVTNVYKVNSRTINPAPTSQEVSEEKMFDLSTLDWTSDLAILVVMVGILIILSVILFIMWLRNRRYSKRRRYR